MSGRRFISYIFIAGSAVLLFLGARDFIGSYVGQIQAGRDFESSSSEPLAPSPSTTPPSDTRLDSANRREASADPPEAHAFRPRLGETVAKLIIPRLDAEVFIVEGDGKDELRKGPGHLAGSAPPGGKGNCIIAGHRDTHFRVLKDIRRGDDIVLETREGQFLYRVKKTQIVSPHNTAALKPTSDPKLNLITCYPFYFVGSAPKRFVVEAKLTAALGG
jgi:LPXTG-site transpeptidase (sortase) family protein